MKFTFLQPKVQDWAKVLNNSRGNNWNVWAQRFWGAYALPPDDGKTISIGLSLVGLCCYILWVFISGFKHFGADTQTHTRLQQSYIWLLKTRVPNTFGFHVLRGAHAPMPNDSNTLSVWAGLWGVG